VIPKLIDIQSLWNVLPPGVHDATLEEIEQHFATNETRNKLFDGFRRGVAALRKAGCTTVFLDGSFVCDKPNPEDFDACWDPVGVDPSKLDPIFLDFSDLRKRQKEKYAGEFFPSSTKADGVRTFVEFFQMDKHSGNVKGVIRVQLKV